MSTSAESLRAALLADAAVAAQVAARVRFDLAAEDDPYPFLVLRQVGNQPIRGLDKSIHARRETYHVESWGETRAQSAALHALVESALVDADMEPDEADPDALDPEIGARACVWVVDIWSDT